MFAAGKTSGGGAAATVDPQFNYVTMLLHGDGTNGAQNNTFVDSSTNNFTITRVGNTTQGSYSPFGSNWSNFFNGTDANLVFANNANLNLGSGDFTLECWFYHLTGTGNGVIWSQWNNGGDNSGQLLTNGTGLIYRIGAAQWSFGTFVANNWTHVAVTRSGSTVRMFVNGVVARTETNSTNITTTGTTIIGANDNGTNNFFNGYISNFRQVKGTAVYTSNFTPSTTPLTAITNTQLLTCQSNRFIDNSSNAFFPSINGTPSIQRFNPFGASTAYSTSVIGGSGYFDGSGDSLRAPSNAVYNLGTSAFTIEAYVYIINNSSNRTIFDRDSGNGFLLMYTSASRIQFYANNIAVINFDATDKYLLNRWAHIAVVRSSNTFTLYIDGTSVATGTNSVSIPTLTTVVGIGGRSDGSDVFYGYLSSVRFSTSAVYTSNFTPPTAPPTQSGALLLNMVNGAIFDNAMMNDLETVGNAQISTSVKKYGTGSLAFDGSGDYLQAPDSPVFNLGSGNWTIESWIYINSAKNYNGFYGKRQAGQFGLTLQIDNSGVLSISASITGSSWALAGASLGSGYTTGAWMHVAVTRSGTTITGWLNGTSTGTQTLTGAIFPSTGYPAVIGSAFDTGSAQDLNGYMDDFRFTNGFCRYTTTFTPPTAAFPNTGPY